MKTNSLLLSAFLALSLTPLVSFADTVVIVNSNTTLAQPANSQVTIPDGSSIIVQSANGSMTQYFCPSGSAPAQNLTYYVTMTQTFSNPLGGSFSNTYNGSASTKPAALANLIQDCNRQISASAFSIDPSVCAITPSTPGLVWSSL
jgi:hypothetical protein